MFTVVKRDGQSADFNLEKKEILSNIEKLLKAKYPQINQQFLNLNHLKNNTNNSK